MNIEGNYVHGFMGSWVHRIYIGTGSDEELEFGVGKSKGEKRKSVVRIKINWGGITDRF